MPREIDRQAAAQKRSSRLLIGMAAFIFLGAAVYGVLLFITSRRTPADPDTRYTAENGVAVYYESARWPVCRMTEDPALGPVLELASSEDADDDQYQVVLFQRGDGATYDDFLEKSQDGPVTASSTRPGSRSRCRAPRWRRCAATSRPTTPSSPP